MPPSNMQYRAPQHYNALNRGANAYNYAQGPPRDTRPVPTTVQPSWDTLYTHPQEQAGHWWNDAESHRQPGTYEGWAGMSDPSWKPVGLPRRRNEKGKWVTDTPSYLTIDASELGAQRAATINLINSRNHKDQSTLKLNQTVMTRLVAIRTNNEVNQRMLVLL